MRAHLALPILCWICASFSVPVHGTRSGSFTCARSPPAASSVQELVHRSGVVVEGKLQEEGRESDINQLEREALLRARGAANRTASEIADFEEQVGRAAEESLPNGTSGSELYHVRVRVHQVWQVKSGGLEKDSVVSLIWNVRERCAPLRRGTRYVFFMEPTNDTSVFHSVFPPVETRRSVRRNATQVLCQGCVEPKLKNMKSVEVFEGKKAVLKCEPRAGQTITRLKWYKDGKEFAGKNKPKNVKIKVKNSPELRFRKAKVSDSGLYTCEAINDLGKDSTSANLTVIKAATSTTAPVRTSSHEKQCPEKEKNYCVNGGTCFTIEVAPGNDRLLCRCLPGYNGNRCQDIVPMKVMNGKQAEELYQKRVLTITGICIALLVVGIMCVVAYCKTKKQRKKLHDRLRQSLRNERNAMAAMANGPQISSPPSESLQLVSQYVSKNAILAEHTIEKETETSFSTTPCTSSTQSSTAATQTSTKSWSKGRSEIIISHSHSVLVTSSESSKHVTPSSRRGRLDATGCVRELSAQLKNARDTPDSYKDSPYSERYVSAMTTPNRMSPVELLSPESPKSPPSEMSPPLSSLAMSVPSIPVSPQGEEERPLLFTTPPRLRDKQRQDQNTTISDQYQRNSAHYNHAHEAHSPPPSPQRIVEDDDYETTQEYEAAAPQPSKKLANGGSKAKRTKVNGHTAHKLESNSESSSESSSSESETEDERVGEDTPFLSIQNPLAANLESAAAAVAVSAAPTSACRPAESSRTNPALRLSTKEDLQARLSSVIANQDPIAV